jgi:glyoxylase-like metal-dependent hydrolase (beta-lactamase superfamily II)
VTAAALPVADRWFKSEKVNDWLGLITEPHVDEFLRCNIWHLRGADRDVVVDAGLGVHSLRAEVPHLFERDPALLLTHSHLDHIGGAHEFGVTYAHQAERAETPAPGSLHRQALVDGLQLDLTPYIQALPELMVDAVPVSGYDVDSYRVRPPRVTKTINDGDTIDLGDRVLTALHLPGHSPGSIGLFEPHEGVLFSGDVVYDLPPGEQLLDGIVGGDVAAYIETLDRLADMPIRVVYPGHGDPIDREQLLAVIQSYIDSRGAHRRVIAPTGAMNSTPESD